MPSSQGSRAGLITSNVIFVVLFVIASIVAFYYASQLSKAQAERDDEQRRIADLGDPAGPEIAALKEARASDQKIAKSAKLLNVAVKQRDLLAELVAGPNANALQARLDAVAKIGEVGQQLKPAGISIPEDSSLISAIGLLAAALGDTQTRLLQAQSQLKESSTQLAGAMTQKTEELAKKDQTIEQIRKQAQTELAAAAADRQAKQGQLESLEKDRAAERNKAIAEIDTHISDFKQQLRENGELKDELAKLQRRLGIGRLDPSEIIVRQPDGAIISLAGDGVVTINRGLGDHINPGLTFQVYDRIEGIPPADKQSADSLPPGKGSIEVIRVGEHSSQCRITSQTPGTYMANGDLIVNLVYDPNVKYNFVVYGNFDLDHNDVATAQDAEVIKRLITQWGGKVVSEVNVDTDFLVLGAEPTLPQYTNEDLIDPTLRKKQQDAQAALDAYLKVVDKAQSLHIPVLNQNRFLYFVGYYDYARR